MSTGRIFGGVDSDRLRIPIAVYGVLVHDERLLLTRRAGTGYRDGQLGLPAGHLNAGEDVVTALVRELDEELGITVKPRDIFLAVVLHSRAEDADDSDYIHLFFRVTKWSGTPVIAEPDKCTELVWAAVDRLPDDVIDYVVPALTALRDGEPLVLFGWPDTS